MTVKEILVDYSTETTAHALHQIFDNKRRIWARIFWTLIFLVCSAVVVYQLYGLVVFFTSFPTVVSTTLGFKQLPFPAVTFCNYNPLKRSKIEAKSEIGIYLAIYENFLKAKSQLDMKQTCDEFRKQLITTNNSSIAWALACNSKSLTEYSTSNNKANIDPDINYAKSMYLQLQNKAQIDISLLMTLDMQKNTALYDMHEMIESCSYNMMACKDEDFTRLENAYYGLCYTFNKNKSYIASKSGSIYGLKVLMDVRADEYLLSTDVVGAKVTVQEAGTEPMPELDGISVSPGYRTSIGVIQVQSERLSYPYGKCNNTTINIEKCLMDCQKKRVWDICQCVWFGYGMNNMCMTPEQHACGSSAQSNVSAHLTMEDCGCIPSCHETSFKPTVSQNLFPSAALLTAKCAVNGTVNESCTQMVKANWLEFEIYYEKLNYQVYEELPAYQLQNLLSDIGGSVGLWLGASVCTVGEWFTLLLSVVAYCFCLTKQNIEKKSGPVRPEKLPLE